MWSSFDIMLASQSLWFSGFFQIDKQMLSQFRQGVRMEPEGAVLDMKRISVEEDDDQCAGEEQTGSCWVKEVRQGASKSLSV